MTLLFNWLSLIAFSAVAIAMAHWITRQSFERWRGPKTVVSVAFLYALTLAAITGISFVGATVFYNSILEQGAFMDLAGMSGVVKFLLIYSGVWYGAVYALKLQKEARP